VLVALATAAAVVLPVSLRVALKGAIQHESVPRVTYPSAISSLQVQANGGGAVTIRSGRPGQVTVSSALSWVFGKPAVTQEWQGGTFFVGATCPKFDAFEDCQAQVTITIPAGTPVQAVAGAGSVTVSGLSGPVHLTATSGFLLARNVSGLVWASATTGSVVARGGLTSASVDASVTSGRLSLVFAVPPRTVAIVVDTGSAAITLPSRSRYRVVSSVGSGALQIAPGISDGRSDRELRAAIGSGNVSIGYTPGPG
jgi:hypothetical protein